MTYQEWKALSETNTITVDAHEIDATHIEISLPAGKAVVCQVKERGDQAPVVSANVRGLRAHFHGADKPYDASDFAGGFQVNFLNYSDGKSSHYLGNCFDPSYV